MIDLVNFHCQDRFWLMWLSSRCMIRLGTVKSRLCSLGSLRLMNGLTSFCLVMIPFWPTPKISCFFMDFPNFTLLKLLPKQVSIPFLSVVFRFPKTYIWRNSHFRGIYFQCTYFRRTYIWIHFRSRRRHIWNSAENL